MERLKKRFGIRIIIVFAIILAAIPLTVYIAQQQQEIRQRASEPNSDISSQTVNAQTTAIPNGNQAFGVAGTAYPENLGTVGATWMYSWSASLSGDDPQKAHRDGVVNYAPMFRLGVNHWKNQGFAQNPNSCSASSCPTNRVEVQRKIRDVLLQMGTLDNYYILGNEINIGGGEDSDDGTIPLQVEQFKLLVEEIKRQDPSAKIVSPSTLGWLQQTRGKDWMNNFIAEYRRRYNNQNPPFDVLNIHLYDIPHATWRNGQIAFRASGTGTEDVQLLIRDLEDFREWSQTVGYGSLPIWITEFGLLHCDGAGCAHDADLELVQAASNIIRNLLTYFRNNQVRLGLERWFIFVTYEEYPNRVYPIKMFIRDGINYPDGQQPITVYGRIYKEFSEAARVTMPPTPTFPPASVSVSPTATIRGSTITIQWNGLPPRFNTKDWAALFAKTASTTQQNVKEWLFLGSCSKQSTILVSTAAGNCPMTIPSGIPLGEYEIRIMKNNSLNPIAVAQLIIGNTIPTTILSPTPTPIESGPTPTESGQAPVLGDANGDGQVNLADFHLWLRESRRELPTRQSDFNRDNIIDDADFRIWRNAFTSSP